MTGMRTKGFTLLELLFTVTIAAILLTLGVPSFLEMLDKRRVVGAAEGIYSEMQLARSQSIEINQPVRVVFTRTSASDWCYGLTTRATCDCNSADNAVDACELLTDLNMDGDTADTDESPYRVFSSSDFNEVTLTDPSANGTEIITFSPLRMTAGANAIEVTSGKGKVIQVVVSNMGGVHICSPQGANQVAGYQDSNGGSAGC